MGSVSDWTRFETGAVGPEEAFEALAAQLFERWLRRDVIYLIVSALVGSSDGRLTPPSGGSQRPTSRTIRHLWLPTRPSRRGCR